MTRKDQDTLSSSIGTRQSVGPEMMEAKQWVVEEEHKNNADAAVDVDADSNNNNNTTTTTTTTTTATTRIPLTQQLYLIC